MQSYVLAFCNMLHILQEIPVRPFLLLVVRKLNFIPHYFFLISNEAVG